MSIFLGQAQVADNSTAFVNAGTGLEIGDIGIALFGIDETQNKRRYLNGQVISQTQFPDFTAKLKKAIELYPSLATTEENWQAQLTNSVQGQCGRFVIDDSASTIRLPKVKDITGLQNLSGLGTIMLQSAPNITGEWFGYIAEVKGAIEVVGAANYTTTDGASGPATRKLKLDASRSSSTYGANGNVLHQEAVQYPYFIQVATGVEESVDVSKEVQLNNPFFLGMSQYFENEPKNLSWLKSDGQFKSGTTYVSIYNFIVKNVNAGIEGFKGTTGYCYKDVGANGYRFWIATKTPIIGTTVYDYEGSIVTGKVEAIDAGNIIFTTRAGNTYTCARFSESDTTGSDWISNYDFVLNTADTTFRLPLLNGEEDLLSDKYKDLTLKSTGSSYTAPANGWFFFRSSMLNGYGFLEWRNKSANDIAQTDNSYGGTPYKGSIFPANRGDDVVFSYLSVDPNATKTFRFYYATGNGSLYFYVGETVQDANIINAAGVLTKVGNSIDRTVASDRELVVGWGIPDYSAGIGITSFPHTVTFKGWLVGQTSQVVENFIYVNGCIVAHAYNNYSQVQIPVDVGDVITITGSSNVYVYPMKGAK